jgi:hypothetical protein
MYSSFEKKDVSDATQRLINKYKMFCNICHNLFKATEYYYKTTNDHSEIEMFFKNPEFNKTFDDALSNIVAVSENIENSKTIKTVH